MGASALTPSNVAFCPVQRQLDGMFGSGSSTHPALKCYPLYTSQQSFDRLKILFLLGARGWVTKHVSDGRWLSWLATLLLKERDGEYTQFLSFGLVI
jgi:hypothetical protein